MRKKLVLTAIQESQEVTNLKTRLKRTNYHNKILQRSLNMAINKVLGNSSMTSVELQDYFMAKAKKEYEFYLKNGKNPGEFDFSLLYEIDW